MANPYVGEIRCFGFNFAPQDWAQCNGQLLAIADNTTLFALIGTTYGGDGVNTFGLPNLQGRIPMHWGSPPGLSSTVLGQAQGTSTVTPTINQIPQHRHTILSEMMAPGGVLEHAASPTSSAFIGPSAPEMAYKLTPTIDSTFSPKTIGSTGGGQPHENEQPFLVLNFCIALFGIFPSQN